MGLFDFFKRHNKKKALVLSKVKSKKRLETALKSGELVTLYLTPLTLGGAEDYSNVVYAPPAAAKLKEQCDDMAEKLFTKGDISFYRAMPSFNGKSLVPSSIKIKMGGETNLEQTINIW